MVGLLHIGIEAAITWDPFVRGVLITALFVLLLPGSVYLVLATDTGARVGFLLIAAGMTGMLSLLATLWMPLASTANVGRPNSWQALNVVTGTYTDHVVVKGAADFPANEPQLALPPVQSLKKKPWYWPLQSCDSSPAWHRIDPSLVNDPESTADKVLAPSSSSSGAAKPSLTSPFSQATEYIYIDGYEKGADGGCLFAINRHKVYLPLSRGAHFVVLRVLPVLPTLNTGGAPPTPQPDKTQAYTYVVLSRDLGSVRQPQALLAISMGLTFLVICYLLHTREKEAMEKEAAAVSAPEREKVGAGV